MGATKGHTMKPRKVLYLVGGWVAGFVFIAMTYGWFGWAQNTDQALVWIALAFALEAKAGNPS